MQPERDERGPFEAILRASTRLVLAPDAPDAVARDAGGWLADQGVAKDDAAALAAIGDRRLLLYRRHVRRALERATRQEIPRTAARLGDAFAGWVTRWIDEDGPRSPYFRDVAFELVAWAAPRWATDPSVPAYLGDLARHELAYFEVASAPDHGDPAVDRAPEEVTLDRPLRFAASARLFRYAHAVHTLAEDLGARDVPETKPTALLAYRDAEHDVRFLELTPLAAAILERLLAGEALGAAVASGCAQVGSALDASVTASTAALLEDLLARGAVLGGEAC